MRKYRIFALFFIIVTLASFFTAYLSGKVIPMIRITAEAELNNRLSTAVNAALADIDNTSEAVSCISENNGEIGAFMINTAKLSALRSDIADSVQNQLNSEAVSPMSVSLGSLSGIPFLYGRGSRLNLNFGSITSISCDTESEFVSAGINQTLHRIVLKICVTSGLCEPGLSDRISAETSVILCETVIVGKVPDAYTFVGRTDGAGISTDEFDVRSYKAS